MAVKESFDLAKELSRGNRLVSADADVALRCSHCGPAVAGAVTVAVVGTDILFVVDGVADTTIQVGATPGTIDLTDPAGGTMAEVNAAINNSPLWECQLRDVLTGDLTDPGGSSALLPRVATAAAGVEVDLFKDTSIALNLSMVLSQDTLPVNGTPLAGITNEAHRAQIFKMTSNTTYGAGTSLVQIYSIHQDKYGVVITEDLIFQQTGGVTTVDRVDTFTEGTGPLDRQLGYKLLARVINSTTMTAGTLALDASSFDVPKSAT